MRIEHLPPSQRSWQPNHWCQALINRILCTWARGDFIIQYFARFFHISFRNEILTHFLYSVQTQGQTIFVFFYNIYQRSCVLNQVSAKYARLQLKSLTMD